MLSKRCEKSSSSWTLCPRLGGHARVHDLLVCGLVTAPVTSACHMVAPNKWGKVMPVSWHYQVMGETIGPLTSKQVRELAKNGTITRDTLLRNREEGKWVLADRVKGLFKEPHPEMTDIRLSTAIINSEKESHTTSKRPIWANAQREPPERQGFVLRLRVH